MATNDDFLGIHNIQTGLGAAGVGFIVVPNENNRKQYIEDCYRTNTVTINGGIGSSFFNSVPISPDVLQNIHFPNPEEDNRGTPVVWVTDHISNMPIIIGWLRREGEHYFMGENKYRVTRGNDSKNIEIFVDGDTTDLQITMIGDKENPANLKIKINSDNEDSEFELYCDNKIDISAEKEVSLNTTGKFSINITDNSGVSKASITCEKGKGLIYQDEYENKITAKDGEIKIESDKINFGSGKEPLVLGDTLVKTLSSLIDAISALTVATPVGISSAPVNSAQFTVIKSKLKEILSPLSNTD